jgi:hypothetical protein
MPASRTFFPGALRSDAAAVTLAGSLSLAGCTGFNPAFQADAGKTSGLPESTGVDASTSTTTGTTSTSTTTGTAMTEGSGDLMRIFSANVAACTDPVSENPDLCETNEGPGGRVFADIRHPDLDATTTVFVKFTIRREDPELDLELEDAQLIMSAAAALDTTGAVWTTEVFASRDALYGEQPALLDRVAAEQGAHNEGDNVRFLLPASAITGEHVYFAIVPGNETHAAYGRDEDVGPRLQLEYRVLN